MPIGRSATLPDQAPGESDRDSLRGAGEGVDVAYYLVHSMVIGAASESYRTLRHLVERLPVMIAPAWLRTRTQPIAIDDVLDFLRAAPGVEQSIAREVQIGGPDVVSYGELLERMARVLGKRARPMLPVPFLSPKLSSLWIGLVTPVDAGVARPLVEGLSTETVVTDPGAAEAFGLQPLSCDDALRRAVAEERGAKLAPS